MYFITSLVKKVEIFCPQIIADADMKARLNEVDIGLASLLTGCEDKDVSNLRERVIEAFCNMRGKDYVRNRRAFVGFNSTKTHRSKIGTIAKQVKDKAKTKKTKTEEENAAVVIDNEINVVDAMICGELSAELKKP